MGHLSTTRGTAGAFPKIRPGLDPHPMEVGTACPDLPCVIVTPASAPHRLMCVVIIIKPLLLTKRIAVAQEPLLHPAKVSSRRSTPLLEVCFSEEHALSHDNSARTRRRVNDEIKASRHRPVLNFGHHSKLSNIKFHGGAMSRTNGRVCHDDFRKQAARFTKDSGDRATPPHGYCRTDDSDSLLRRFTSPSSLCDEFADHGC